MILYDYDVKTKDELFKKLVGDFIRLRTNKDGTGLFHGQDNVQILSNSDRPSESRIRAEARKLLADRWEYDDERECPKFQLTNQCVTKL